MATKYTGNKEDYCGQCDISDWSDIVAIAADYGRTVGIKSDGSVIVTNDTFDSDWRDVYRWKLFKTEAEKEADYATARKLETSDMETDLKNAVDLFKELGNYKDSSERFVFCNRAYEKKKAAREECERIEREARERDEAARRRAEEAVRKKKERDEKIAALNAEKTNLQTELSNLKGFFSGKRRKQIEARLAEIEDELKRL